MPVFNFLDQQSPNDTNVTIYLFNSIESKVMQYGTISQEEQWSQFTKYKDIAHINICIRTIESIFAY